MTGEKSLLGRTCYLCEAGARHVARKLTARVLFAFTSLKAQDSMLSYTSYTMYY